MTQGKSYLVEDRDGCSRRGHCGPDYRRLATSFSRLAILPQSPRPARRTGLSPVHPSPAKELRLRECLLLTQQACLTYRVLRCQRTLRKADAASDRCSIRRRLWHRRHALRTKRAVRIGRPYILGSCRPATDHGRGRAAVRPESCRLPPPREAAPDSRFRRHLPR